MPFPTVMIELHRHFVSTLAHSGVDAPRAEEGGEKKE